MSAVICPDCKTGSIEPGGSCSNCSLRWDDLEDAAAFVDRLGLRAPAPRMQEPVDDAPAIVGQRVRLVRTLDSWTRLRAGDEGVVSLVDDVGTVHVRWDNGLNLGLVRESGDAWEIVR
jgi:hypothetical protein